MKVREFVAWAGNELKSLAAKEIFKAVVLGIGTLILGWMWAALQRVFSEDLSGLPLVDRLRATALDFYADPLTFSLTLLRDHLSSTLLALVLIAGYAILFVLLRRARRRLDDVLIERELAIQAGIGGWWPHAQKENEGGAPWSELCSEINLPENRQLLILGANGVDTFGRPEAPLYNALQNFRGTVRVVLAAPESEQTAGRAAAVNVRLADYKRAIGTSVTRLRDLRRQHHAVEGRYYDGAPNWKMLITSRTAWIQYYAPGTHVDQTPVWRFDVTKDGNGLYHLFAAEFDRIWRRCEHHDMFAAKI